MAKPNSTSALARTKPEKPYSGFPLYAHASGKWAKKCRGKLFYFGKWDDPQAALREYKEWAEATQGSSQLAAKGKAAITLGQLCNSFLAHQEARASQKQIAHRTFTSLLRTARLMVEHLGRQRRVCNLGPLDFTEYRNELASRMNPVGVTNEVTRVKQFFHWGEQVELIDRVNFGPDFKRSPKAVVRRHKRDNPRQLFTAAQLRKLIKSADVHLKAMILLGLNCGANNSDIADLRLNDIDLESGWLDAPRRKTAIDRKCPLWPETVKAIQDSLAERPSMRTPAARDRVFVRSRGIAYDESKSDNPCTKPFTRLCRKLGIDRDGQSFYLLRHQFATWANEWGTAMR